jgi:hypothetical protein
MKVYDLKAFGKKFKCKCGKETTTVVLQEHELKALKGKENMPSAAAHVNNLKLGTPICRDCLKPYKDFLICVVG